MAITEQARAQANKIVSDIRVSVLTDVYWNDVAERITTAIEAAHVHPASLTDAIEAVRDYRKWYDESIFTPTTIEETQAVHQQFDGMVDRISAQAARHTIDKLVENLESLEGKAPGQQLPRVCVNCENGEHEYCQDVEGCPCKCIATPSSGEEK